MPRCHCGECIECERAAGEDFRDEMQVLRDEQREEARREYLEAMSDNEEDEEEK